MTSTMDSLLCSNIIKNARILNREYEEYALCFEEHYAGDNLLAAYNVAARLHFMLAETLDEFDKNRHALKSTLTFLTTAQRER